MCSPISTTDLKGYGAIAKLEIIQINNTSSFTWYCDYVEIDKTTLIVNVVGGRCRITENPILPPPNNYNENYYDGVRVNNLGILGFISKSNYDENVTVYGDVRYTDGTPADDVTTPITDIPKDDDDPTIPEDILEDLLNELINKLQLQYPDLSTIEGLLRAILAKLGTLDSDNDNGILNTINTTLVNGFADLKTAISGIKSTTENNTENNFNFSDFFGDFTMKDILSNNTFTVTIKDILSGNKFFL